MQKILELSEKVDEIERNVLIDNTTDNDLVEAYNQGVRAMAANIQYTLNQMALAFAFPDKVGD